MHSPSNWRAGASQPAGSNFIITGAVIPIQRQSSNARTRALYIGWSFVHVYIRVYVCSTACPTSHFSMNVGTTVSLAGDDEPANRQTTRNRRGSESTEARKRRLAGNRARRLALER